MKIRKEFLIFGGVIVLLIVVLLISKIAGGTKPYNGDDVVLNFGESEVSDQSQSSILDIGGEDDGTVMGDTEGTPIDTILDVPEDAVTSETSYSGEIIPDNEVDGIIAVGDPLAAEWDSQPSSSTEIRNSDVDEDDGDYRGQKPTPEQYVYMLMYYVCGLEDSEMFPIWLTADMQAEFNQHLDEEPYATLNGNSSFKIVDMQDDSFSFQAKDGKTYKFSVEFFGDMVSGVTFVS